MKKTSDSGKMGFAKKSIDTKVSYLPENGGIDYESYRKYFYTNTGTCQQK